MKSLNAPRLTVTEKRVMNPRQFSEDVADLTRRTAEANTALVRGDIDGYLALIEHATDDTLMAPFGGAPTRGFDMSGRAAMARFFKSGTFGQEVAAIYATGDLVVLVRRRQRITYPPLHSTGRVISAFRNRGTAATGGLRCICHFLTAPNDRTGACRGRRATRAGLGAACHTGFSP